MLYSASSRLQLGFERPQVAFEFAGGAARRYRSIRNQTSGSHSSRAYGTGRSSMSTSVASEPPTICEQVAQLRRRRVGQKRARCRSASPVAGLAVLGRRARQLERLARSPARRSGGNTSVIENGRGARAEQRLVQIGIERRELLVGRLLGQLGVRPEALERRRVACRNHRKRGIGVGIARRTDCMNRGAMGGRTPELEWYPDAAATRKA